MFDQITPLVVELAASPLVYVVLFALCLVDGFFPPVPSESALVAIAAVAATSGQPVLAVVLVAAALGAIAGDSIAYWIGRRIGFARLARSKRPRIAAAFAFAERQMQRRSASLILTGRFIPVGRVAVNMTAGATRLSYRRFLAISAIAGLAWSAVSIGIALAASSVLHEPIVAALVSMVVAAGLGIAVDRVLGTISRRREARAAAAAAAPTPAPATAPRALPRPNRRDRPPVTAVPKPRPAWVRPAVQIGFVVVVVSLFAVAAPVTAVFYGVPVPLAMLATAVLSASIGLAPLVPRTASVAHLVALAGLGILTASGTVGPWPVSVTSIIGLSVLLVVLGVRTTWRLTAVVWVAATLLTLLLIGVTPDRWGQVDVWATSFVVSAGDTLVVAAAAVVIGQRRTVREELAAARRDTELEQARRRTVEERSRIARELHDVVAHSMSVVHMQAESAPYRVADLPPEARTEFAAIAETSRTALREMRQLLGTLRGDADAERAPQPRLADLHALVQATRAAGIPVELRLDEGLDPDLDDVDRLAQLTVYRVVQEALGNVARHAPGATTVVTVGRHGSTLTVEVANTAPPVGSVPGAPPDDGGFGLAGMRERVAALRGTIDHGPDPDGGFRVAVRLPTRPATTKSQPTPDGASR